jgi:prephenate dehydrogenase
VEDIAIEHDPAREIGYLQLSVTPAEADALEQTMTGRGWSVV